MNFSVSKSPIGPRRTSGSRKWFLVRMADGSVRCFGSAAAAQRFIDSNKAPSVAAMLRASLAA